MNIEIPKYADEIIDRLESAGHETYIVGGCVRDSIEKVIFGTDADAPHDWDMCTSALPEEIAEALGSGWKLIPTGIRHGTVTVWKDDPLTKKIEITAFRTDGRYSDGRHPDRVRFTEDINEDLARRDFTVNAMAYSPIRGLIDPFGGSADLRVKLLRCVGDPVKRFGEDGLRILRCLRFSAVKGYNIEENTGAAIIKCREMLNSVSWERIDEEIMKLLRGQKPGALIDEYRDVFTEMIPELRAEIGFEQRSPYHNRDVWHHTLAAVDDIPPDMPELRFIMLFHDIAKPAVCVIDKDGRGRFQNHPEVGSEMTVNILKRMKFSAEFIERARILVLYHDTRVPANRADVRKFLSRTGEEIFRQILIIQHADGAGKYAEFMPETEKRLKDVEELIDSIIDNRDCISLKQLAVNGHDLISAGIPRGRRVGALLNRLLELVMEDRLSNDRESILKYVEENRRRI